jgi:glutamate synthase domain-containing protein 1
MCGIVGLFIKERSLEPSLGSLLANMLEVMTGRGPDSAGFAIYNGGAPDQVKLTLRGDGVASIGTDLPVRADVRQRDTHVVLSVAGSDEATLRKWLTATHPQMAITGAGQSIELYKEVGLPADVASRFGLSGMSGTHGIGHTRMATESAVTTAGAHPFSTGPDQCLVHNGSLSNHRSIRRLLEANGMDFNTDNDSEVAAGYLSWRLQQGASLSEALEASLNDLDGFFTFVVGTRNGFAVLRDPISCKPAVMAETESYVAFGSEYRALVGLPGIENARIFEPEPARVYVWERN